MREHREQILFVITLVVLGLFSWSRLTDTYVHVRAPSAASMPLDPIARPAPVALVSGASGASAERGRSAFEPPRELLPLDPLQLPDPPLPRLDLRRPSVTPGRVDPNAYRVSGESLGELRLPEQDGPVFAESAGREPLAGGEALDESENGQEAVPPDELYDWVVRPGSTRRTYGRILNDDVYGLASRPQEALLFQQITLRTGRPLGVPFEIPRDDVAEFKLARSFDNLYHERSRSLGNGAGAARTRAQLALEMLAQVGAHEHAVEYAEAEARLAFAGAPADPGVSRLLASVLRELGDLEGELAVYRGAELRGVVDAPLLADHALLARRLGLTERARELLDQADLVNDTAAEVDRVAGLLLADEGRHAEAVQAFDRVGQHRFSPPFEQRQEREAELARGASLIALGRIQEARRAAERLLLEDDSDAGALALQGAALAADDKPLDALQSISRALLQQPSSSRLLTNAGLLAWRLDDGATALRSLRQARQSEPWKAFPAILALGFLREDAGQPDRARDRYEQALQLRPDQPEGLYRLGRLLRITGDPEGARELLGRALRLGGGDVLLLDELGASALLSDDPRAAGFYLREALRTSPDDAQVLWLLGLTDLEQGDLLGAVERLERAAGLGASGAYGALGVARYRLDQVQDALDAFDEVGRAFAGQADHPQARFAATQAAAIRDNLSKRQWRDDFVRTKLKGGWEQHNWSGSPGVLLAGHEVVVRGRMEKPRKDERPGISRPVEGRTLVSAEAGMAAEPGTGTRFGLSLTHKQIKGVLGQLPKGRLEIWVDEQGQLRLSALDNFETKLLDGLETGVRVEPGTRVLLGIERLDPLNGVYAFLLDGRRVGDPVTIKAMRDLRNNTLQLELWAEAAPGRNVDARFDLARIVRLP